MNKTINWDILIKQQTDRFGHFNASDANARLLCVSVLFFPEAQLQSSWGQQNPLPPSLDSELFISTLTYQICQAVHSYLLSITRYRGQEASISRHLNLRSRHCCSAEWDSSLSVILQHILIQHTVLPVSTQLSVPTHVDLDWWQL